MSEADRDEIDRIANEIQDRSVNFVGEDRNSGGAVMVPRDDMVEWMDDLRAISDELPSDGDAPDHDPVADALFETLAALADLRERLDGGAQRSGVSP